jgi:NAD(P)H-hydrate epimerase
MKLLWAQQIRELDSGTMEREGIPSLDLMERAAAACSVELLQRYPSGTFAIFCGTGNNGGDGLAIGRLLADHGCRVSVYLVGNPLEGTADFKANLERLKLSNIEAFVKIEAASDIPSFPSQCIAVDALMGTGINRPLSGLLAEVVLALNGSALKVVSVDIPSGLPADPEIFPADVAVYADVTLSFHLPKRSFLFAETGKYVGKLVLLDILLNKELHASFGNTEDYLTADYFRNIVQPRARFTHKGTYGHCLVMAGSQGKTGAAILSAEGALRSGCGLLSVHLPSTSLMALHVGLPEAMGEPDLNPIHISEFREGRYQSIVCGPGIGQHSETAHAVESMLRKTTLPRVLDADALNLLAANPSWWTLIRESDVLTPHPGEFRRLFGESESSLEECRKLLYAATSKKCFIVLKGAYTRIATPDGRLYFSSTGNSGMATAGSGDVLSGVIGGLMATGYGSEYAALLGVYLHGAAGDLAAEALGQEAMLSGDILKYLGRAWKDLHLALSTPA